MNYILIMTEGPDELAFVNVLIKKGILKFPKDELLMEKPFHLRQIKGEVLGYIQVLSQGDKVIIYRVGDKLSDKLIIPPQLLDDKIEKKIDICTLPEFEILFIINEGMYDEFQKVKSNTKASEFYKSKNKRYKKQSSFVYEYFNQMTNAEIYNLINLYVKKQGKNHNKSQKTFLELLK